MRGSRDSVCYGTTHSSVIRHQVAGCQPSLVVLGFAQAFFPKTNWGFFAVKVPPEETYEPDVPTPISCHFKAKFTLQLTANQLITVPSNTRDMNHFLSLGNWFQEVSDLTGGDANNIICNSLPDLRPLVCKSMNLYIETKNQELRAEDLAVKVAMGNYNKWVFSNIWAPSRLPILGF